MTNPFAAGDERARRIFEEYGSDEHWPDFETCILCMAHAYKTLRARYDVLVDGAKLSLATADTQSAQED